MNELLDGFAAVLLVVGAAMSLGAAIGLLTLPDLLSRMHAATKPQVFGLLLLLLAVALALRTWALVPLLVLMWIFQLLTIPVGGHMVARAGYRTRHTERRRLAVDELRDVVQRAAEDQDRQDDDQRVDAGEDGEPGTVPHPTGNDDGGR